MQKVSPYRFPRGEGRQFELYAYILASKLCLLYKLEELTELQDSFI